MNDQDEVKDIQYAEGAEEGGFGIENEPKSVGREVVGGG